MTMSVLPGDQPGYDQPGYDQPGYDQPGYDQPGYDQPGYDQPGYDQTGYATVEPAPVEAGIAPGVGVLVSVNPYTGEATGSVAVSGEAEIADTLAAAAAAAPTLAAATPQQRGRWLEGLADAVQANADELAALADQETGLGRTRLDGEVLRCANQLRFYAEVAREGSWLGATLDHATATTPDLRKLNVPLGPVAVFGASNFPFAFGTLGNDTGSALAAGCPVVVKGHPAHPLLHARLMEVAVEALTVAGAPVGCLGSVVGLEAGLTLVAAEQITAVGFTGSQAGGMTLWSAAQRRPTVIPVYAEMGTVNPVVVTQAAAEADLSAIAAGCVESFTMGMGQFCTKPGLLLAPAGSGMAEAVGAALVARWPQGPMLTPAIAHSYVRGIDLLVGAGGWIVASVADPGPGVSVCAVVVAATPAALRPGSPLLEECFGPVIIVVEYADAAELALLLGRLQPALVGSVMTTGADDPDTASAIQTLAAKVGRVAVNAWPTGVATLWAQHHGGPWPSTTVARTTSVGASALDRFTRPVTYQNTPDPLLPPALRQDNPWKIVRRVDGAIKLPRTTRAGAGSGTGRTAAKGSRVSATTRAPRSTKRG